MSCEIEEHRTVDHDHPAETDNESLKKLKFSYTRDFLISLSDLDVCKKLPSGFNESFL